MIEKFIENGIHYIKETLPNGSWHIFPDPDFQVNDPDPPLPDLPPLVTPNDKLDFIIQRLGLKKGFNP